MFRKAIVRYSCALLIGLAVGWVPAPGHTAAPALTHEGEANPNPAPWSWARFLKRVLAIDRATCPQGQQSPLRLIAALTDPPVIRRRLSHLKLSPHPAPIEPARWVQAPFACISP